MMNRRRFLHILSASFLAVPIVAIAVSACVAWHLVRIALRMLITIDGARYALLGDDMMISLRYAYNLAHGQGLVWNPGERIQGITNIGWTLIGAIPYAVGMPLGVGPVFLQGVNIMLHAGLVFWLFQWSWRRGRALQGVVAAVLVTLDVPITAWGVSGFETTAQAFLVTAACLPFLDERGDVRWTPIWAALATVIRPDALLIFGAVAFLVCIWACRRGCVHAVAPSLIVSVGLIGALFVGQRLYYGAWLPNSFALKVTGGAATIARGLDYLGRFSGPESFSLPLLCAPGVYVMWCRITTGAISRRVLSVVGITYVWLAYVVWVGGDAFQYGRFCVPIIPLMALFTGALVEELARSVWGWSAERRFARVSVSIPVVALVVAGLAGHVRAAWPIIRAGQPPIRDGLSSACIALAIRAMALPVGRVIAVYYAGVTPYLLPEHRFHDFLGKADRHIAETHARAGLPGHNKWDYAYSLGEVRPDLIVTAGPFIGMSDAQAATLVNREYGFHAELWIDPIFRSTYREHRLFPAPGETAWHTHWVYSRADFASSRPLLMPDGVCRTGPS